MRLSSTLLKNEILEWTADTGNREPRQIWFKNPAEPLIFRHGCKPEIDCANTLTCNSLGPQKEEVYKHITDPCTVVSEQGFLQFCISRQGSKRIIIRDLSGFHKVFAGRKGMACPDVHHHKAPLSAVKTDGSPVRILLDHLLRLLLLKLIAAGTFFFSADQRSYCKKLG